MASGFTLWFCLVGLYLVESLRLTAVRSLIFRPGWFGSGSKGMAPNTYPGNGRWGWTLLPLGPMRDPVLICQQPLVAWGPEHFAPNVIFVQSVVAAKAYEEVRIVSVEEKTLLVDGRKFVRCESEAEANRARDVLEKLRALNPEKRETAIRDLVKTAFAEKNAREGIARMRAETLSLVILSGVLRWLLLVIFPVLLWLLPVPDAFVIVGVGAVMVALAVAISVSFAKAGGKLHPAERVKYRWKSMKFVVYPVGAMRAADELTLDSLPGVHPVMVSLVLGKGERQLRDAKGLWQQARSEFPMSVQAEAKALECSLWFNKLVCAEMKACLATKLPQALEEESVRPHSAGSLSYCPNCKTQYVTKTGTCADCPGTALQPFADERQTTSL